MESISEIRRVLMAAHELGDKNNALSEEIFSDLYAEVFSTIEILTRETVKLAGDSIVVKEVPHPEDFIVDLITSSMSLAAIRACADLVGVDSAVAAVKKAADESTEAVKAMTEIESKIKTTH